MVVGLYNYLLTRTDESNNSKFACFADDIDFAVESVDEYVHA